MNQQEYLKYLLGRKEWTSAEKEWMLNYLSSDDLSDLETVAAEEYHADLAQMKSILDRKLSEDILHKIHQRIQPPAPPQQSTRFFWWRRMVAAALVIVVAGVLYYIVSGGSSKDVAYTNEVTTSANERKTITLPDGSTVSLQPGSTLRYPETFREKERNVHLTGEAFFSVQHDQDRAFVVHSEMINTTVLGTSFNMDARPDRNAKVVVITGTVKVEKADDDDKEIVVNSHQGVVYNRLTNELQKEDVSADARYYEQRQQGRFVYEGAAVKKVIEDMRRFYNTSIVLRDELQMCKFYGYINTTDSLEKALQMISMSLNAKVTIDSTAGSYIISGGSCE